MLLIHPDHIPSVGLRILLEHRIAEETDHIDALHVVEPAPVPFGKLGGINLPLLHLFFQFPIGPLNGGHLVLDQERSVEEDPVVEVFL